jgi:hypothetical protein
MRAAILIIHVQILPFIRGFIRIYGIAIMKTVWNNVDQTQIMRIQDTILMKAPVDIPLALGIDYMHAIRQISGIG